MKVTTFLLSVLMLTVVTFTTLNAQANNDFHRALKLYKNKKFSEASEILYKYVQEKPTPSAYYLLGYALYKMGKHDEAMKYFKEAYLLDPDFKPETIKFK